MTDFIDGLEGKDIVCFGCYSLLKDFSQSCGKLRCPKCGYLNDSGACDK